MAVTLTMAFAGWIDYPMAAAIILGENIGTTITANLAAIGGTRPARQAARAHLFFNVFGVVWMLILFEPALRLVDSVTPGTPVGAALTTHLAVFHTGFNVVNVSLFIPFLRRFSSMVERFVTDAAPPAGTLPALRFVEDHMRSAPELYLYQIRRELGRMATLVLDMYRHTRRLIEDPEAADATAVTDAESIESTSDTMQTDITHFLASCSTEHLSVSTTEAVVSLMRITHELERIADSCMSLVYLAAKVRSKGMTFGKKARRELSEYVETVDGFLTFSARHVNDRLSETDLLHADLMEKSVNHSRDRLKRRARKRLQKGANVRSELLLVDLSNHLEHIGDFCLNIVQANQTIRAAGLGSAVTARSEIDVSVPTDDVRPDEVPADDAQPDETLDAGTSS